MIAALAKRVLMAALGFCVAVFAGTMGITLALVIFANMFPDNTILSILGLGPIVMVALPVVLLFTLAFVAVLAAPFAAVVIAASEFMAWRAWWVHVSAAVLNTVAAAISLDPLWFNDMGRDKMLVSTALLFGALIAGGFYWLVAGKTAGISRSAVA